MFSRITLINCDVPLRERAKSRKYCGPYYWIPAKPGTGRGFYQNMRGLSCDKHGSTFNLRLEEAREHLSDYSRNRYIYSFYGAGDTKFMPIIARLPHRRGFLAGWTMGEGMLGSIDAHVHPDINSAAISAYNIAERDATNDREDEEVAYANNL